DAAHGRLRAHRMLRRLRPPRLRHRLPDLPRSCAMSALGMRAFFGGAPALRASACAGGLGAPRKAPRRLLPNIARAATPHCFAESFSNELRGAQGAALRAQQLRREAGPCADAR